MLEILDFFKKELDLESFKDNGKINISKSNMQKHIEYLSNIYQKADLKNLNLKVNKEFLCLLNKG